MNLVKFDENLVNWILGEGCFVNLVKFVDFPLDHVGFCGLVLTI